ncbi:YihA family ribosome biogenesis GTP-binding protein, partial [Salinimicrobium sp. CDJ15-91]|nr:YihA family ribosome biogenesis GTP-binding protein [Salinimicrobium oceani]
KPKALERHIEEYKAEMLETWVEMPQYFVTSSASGFGKEEVLDFIQSINDGFLPQQ